MNTITNPKEQTADPGEINKQIYHSQRIYACYQDSILWPAEIASLLKYQPAYYDKRILDLGIGQGRTTHYLAPLASRYVGVDYSPVMVQRALSRWPNLDIRLLDMRDLASFPDESFDFVLASVNLLDAVSHSDRLIVLSEVYRVLRIEGIFITSSHNRNYHRAGQGPRLHTAHNPVTQLNHLLKYLKQQRNYLATKKLWLHEKEYALLSNDTGHDFSLLQYHISRQEQHQQARQAGYKILNTYDGLGNILNDGDLDSHSHGLTYVLQRPK